MIKIRLSAEQRKELEHIRREGSAKDAEKTLMVLMSADGKTVTQIARTLKRNPHTVRDWLKRFATKGPEGLGRKFSPGRPDSKKKKLVEHIGRIIADPPSAHGYVDDEWTVALIAHHASKQLDLSISRDTVVRALKNMGYVYKRQAKTTAAPAASPEKKRLAVKRIAKEIKELANKKDSAVHALDKSYCATEPYLARGWGKKMWPPPVDNEPPPRRSHSAWLLESDGMRILFEIVKET